MIEMAVDTVLLIVKISGTMVRERCRFSLTECGGKLYAIGGCSETAALEDDVSVEW